MTTVGDKDVHFTCQLKMEEQIHCAHSVTLTAPGLVIDKGGTVGQSLSYTFAANDGLTAQDIGIVGHNPGEYTIFADITSPYFVTASGLKVKKDKIGITIRQLVETEGWNGTDHGLRNGGFNGYAGCTDPDLYYKYTHVSGSQTIIFWPISTGESMLIKVSGAYNGVIASNSSVGASLSMSTPGVYIFTPYLDGKYSASALGPAISIVAQKTIGSFPAETATPKRRGVRISNAGPIGVAFNTPIPTTKVIEVVDSYRPGTPPTYLLSYAGSTGIVFTQSGQFGVNATGQFNSPPGASVVSVELRLYDGAGTGIYNNFATLGGAASRV
jgi:hypothetical protein